MLKWCGGIKEKTVKKGKEEENLCMKCFVTHLEKQLGLQNIEYGDDQDPPDFWSKIKDKKYAVEVTRIVNKLGKIPGRPGSIDSAMYRDWLQKLAKKIAQKAKKEGCLRGGYVLSIMRTPNIPRKDQETVSNAVEYICKTKALTNEAGKMLLRDQGGKIDIIKVNNNKDYVVPASILAKSEGKIKLDLKTCLERRISDKRKRLTRPNVPKYDGTVLVIYDKYKFADYEDFPKTVKSMEFFHAVFLVLDPRRERGFFLYIKDKTWG